MPIIEGAIPRGSGSSNLALANTWTQPQTGPFWDKGGSIRELFYSGMTLVDA